MWCGCTAVLHAPAVSLLPLRARWGTGLLQRICSPDVSVHMSVCKHLPVHAHVCVHAVIAASVARFHVYVLIGNKRHLGGGANLPGTFKISS